MVPTEKLLNKLEDLKAMAFMEAKEYDANAGAYGLKMVHAMIQFIKEQDELAKKVVNEAIKKD